jgi:F-type H+-transporting ATPase subunit gamma
MAQNVERANSRLDNIRSIEPLLGSLRTISMGAWQVALNKISKINQYESFYNQILAEILPKIKQGSLRAKRTEKQRKPEIADTIILIIGSERGLCGKFNENLVNNVLRWLNHQNLSSFAIWAMGTRMIRELERSNIDFTWRQELPAGEVSSFKSAYLLSQNWLEQYESYAFNHFFIAFNRPLRGNRYEFAMLELLPHQTLQSSELQEGRVTKWPPAIIETDPKRIFVKIIQFEIATNLFRALLESAAAEHSSRYNLMQEAKNNAEEIIEDLQQVINAERKRKITQDIQELASAAGLLDNK